MAQYILVHQFKEKGFPGIAFTSGTKQALYVGELQISDLSTLINFTIFAFYEQEPNLDDRKKDHLICHLLQVEEQKKLLDKIKLHSNNQFPFPPISTDLAHKSNHSQRQPASFSEKKAHAQQSFDNYSS